MLDLGQGEFPSTSAPTYTGLSHRLDKMVHVKLLDPLSYLQVITVYGSLQHDINGMYKIYHPVHGEHPSLLCSFLSFLLPEMLT